MALTRRRPATTSPATLMCSARARSPLAAAKKSPVVPSNVVKTALACRARSTIARPPDPTRRFVFLLDPAERIERRDRMTAQWASASTRIGASGARRYPAVTYISTDLVARSRMPARALLDLRHARLRARSADLAPRRSVLPIGWVAAARSGQSVRFSSHLPGVRGQGGGGLRRCGFWDAAPTRHAPVRAPAGWLSAWMVLQAVRRQMVA
jgi:hypothetical protein